MNINKIQFGDGLAVRGTSWLSKAIRFFMKQYKPNVKDYSHNAVIIDMWGEKWVAEALAWGVRLRPFAYTEYAKSTNWVILRDKRGFSNEQIKRMSWKCASLAGIRYQYENLPTWIIKIWLKLNLFKKRNEKSIYCSELLAIAINEAYPSTFKSPNATSPADHIASGVYDIIEL
ncbi:MAG: hypothetical protein ACPL2D_10565 [Ignavibacteria bacterium]